MINLMKSEPALTGGVITAGVSLLTVVTGNATLMGAVGMFASAVVSLMIRANVSPTK